MGKDGCNRSISSKSSKITSTAGGQQVSNGLSPDEANTDLMRENTVCVTTPSPVINLINEKKKGAVMSEYDVKLDNMETYAYLLSHFKMTCDEAADEMKKRGLFDENVAIVHEGVSNYMELINKQKGKTNENK